MRAKRDTAAEERSLSVASQWQLMRWKFLKHKLAVVSLVVLVILYVTTIFAEFFSPYDPVTKNSGYVFCPPTRLHLIDSARRFHLRPFVYGVKTGMDEITLGLTYQEDTERVYPLRLFVHGDPYLLWGIVPADLHLFGAEGQKVFLFGTDKMGKDLLSLVIHGGRISLTIGLLGVVISFVLGIIFGGISGYIGGTVDMVIQRIIEFIRSVPTLPLWMALSAALPNTWSIGRVYFAIVIILSLVGWTNLARVIRGKFMSVREEDFVMIARLHGASEARIIFRHLLPSFYSYIIASLTLAIPGMILGETSLSFIGLGMQAPAISWGVLLKESQAIRVLATSPWLLIPAGFVVIAILAFNFVGDGLRDAADPYTRV
jgi:peptide/nickel transport system permease protein